MNEETNSTAIENDAEREKSSCEEIEMFEMYTTDIPVTVRTITDQKQHFNSEQNGYLETSHDVVDDDSKASVLSPRRRETRGHSHASNLKKEDNTCKLDQSECKKQNFMDIDVTSPTTDIMNSSNDSLAELMLATPVKEKLGKSVDSLATVLQVTPTHKDTLNTSRDSLVDMAEVGDLLEGVEWSPLPIRAFSR